MIIIESGASKSAWTYTDKNSTLSFQTVGMRVGSHTDEHIRQTLKQGARQLPSVLQHHVFCYSSGCLNAERNANMRALLLEVFPSCKITVWSDLHAAGRALLGDASGYCGILGTGSVGFYWTGNDVTHLAGGKGFPGGDIGSGSDLGWHLARLFISSQKSFPIELVNEFETEFGPIDQLESKAVLAESQASYYGSFAPFILRHAENPQIHTLITQQFNLFFSELNQVSADLPVHALNLVGSIAYHFKPILEMTASTRGISLKNTLKMPIEQLIRYHHD